MGVDKGHNLEDTVNAREKEVNASNLSTGKDDVSPNEISGKKDLQLSNDGMEDCFGSWMMVSRVNLMILLLW